MPSVDTGRHRPAGLAKGGLLFTLHSSPFTECMEVIKTIAELRRRLASESRVACVPTMGNIHDGHLRLVGIAHEHASLVVTTIFVNRMQFTGGEDFERYPRTFAEDCEKLAAQGVHIVFHPDDTQMYPQPQTFV